MLRGIISQSPEVIKVLYSLAIVFLLYSLSSSCEQEKTMLLTTMTELACIFVGCYRSRKKDRKECVEEKHTGGVFSTTDLDELLDV